MVIQEGGHQDGGPPSTCARGGRRLRLETLLYGLLLQSGNDAALAVARHCGGTVGEFVAEMNRCAPRLGMANPAALPVPA